MRKFSLLKLSLFSLILALLIIPANVYAGGSSESSSDTDGVYPQDDEDPFQLSSYYDLRERKTYVQVTNDGVDTPAAVTIHVQIFQHDRNCDELNFFDTLTLNDTVVYDLDNLVRNNGTAVPISLLEDSYGYVVVTSVVTGSTDELGPSNLIGNFRIIDDAGYEYRSNMAGFSGVGISDRPINGGSGSKFIANFNSIDDAIAADVIGYGFNAGTATAINMSNGIGFDIFVYDLDEEPLSCDSRIFACGGVMNYGINEDFGNSRGTDLLCPGGSLADPKGGYILFDDINFVGTPSANPGNPAFVGFIGLNNGDGTGSLDLWIVDNNDALLPPMMVPPG